MDLFQAIIAFYLFMIVAVVNSLPAMPATKTQACQEPTEGELQEQLNELIRRLAPNQGSIERSLLVSELPHPNLTIIESDPHFDIHLYGDDNALHCDKKHIEGDGGVAERSLCPWYHVISSGIKEWSRSSSTTSDSLSAPLAKFPKHFAEARCRCDYGATTGIATKCVPVYHHRLVLVRYNQCGPDGKYIYTGALHRVSVGCTSVKADV